MVNRKKDFYGAATGVTEIDLRQEMNNTADGSLIEVSKFQPALLRVFRLDAQNKKILCDCVSKVTGEPDRDRKCPQCLGEGFVWDEEYVTLYHANVDTQSENSDRESQREPFIMNTPMKVFFMQSKFSPTANDKIVLINLDKEGNIISPLTRIDIYKIAALDPMRLDNGRLEFWRLNGYSEVNKHL